MKRQGGGFTLLEVLLVMAVVGILISIATMSMRQFQLRVKLQQAADMIGAEIRSARAAVFLRGEDYQIDFEPASNTFLINGTSRVSLPLGIRFGAAPGVTGRPSDPSVTPPRDGITFRGGGGENRAMFLTKGLVVPTGTVYLTNGIETIAITVGLTGHTTAYQSKGGSKWVEL